MNDWLRKNHQSENDPYIKVYTTSIQYNFLSTWLSIDVLKIEKTQSSFKFIKINNG